jgi:hypothetical protein
MCRSQIVPPTMPSVADRTNDPPPFLLLLLDHGVAVLDGAMLSYIATVVLVMAGW